MHGRWRRLAEIWSLAVGSFLACYFAYYAIRMVQVSHKINDVSQGPDATPLWIPQLGVAVGATVFAVALNHRLVEVVLGGELEPEDGEAGFSARRELIRPMDDVALTAVVLGVMFLLLGTGIWVGLALLGVALTAMVLFTARPAGDAMLTTIWTVTSSWKLPRCRCSSGWAR